MIRFCFHKYSEWSEAFACANNALWQACRCDKCGAIATRKIQSTGAGVLNRNDLNDAIDAVYGGKPK